YPYTTLFRSDSVALVLIHSTVQRFGTVAASVHGLGEAVDLLPGTAEDDRRPRRLDVEHAAERRGFVAPGHDIGGLGDRCGVAVERFGPAQFDPAGVAKVAAHQTGDARRHGGGEQHGLAVVRSEEHTSELQSRENLV